jgi:hypothetical protein
MKRVRIVIQGLDNGDYVKGSSFNILVPDMRSEEIKNIVVNALARYGIQHKYNVEALLHGKTKN